MHRPSVANVNVIVAICGHLSSLSFKDFIWEGEGDKPFDKIVYQTVFDFFSEI